MGKTKDADFPLLAYLDKLVDDLRELTPKAVRDHDEEAVHDARVATRRLKAAVELMGPVLSGKCRKPFAKVTKNIRQQLGALRDLDVMREHLAEFKAAPSQAVAVRWMIDRFAAARDRASKEAEAEAPPARVLAKLGSWWGVRQEIADAQEAVPSLLANSVHLQLDAFAEQADELVKHLGDRAAAADATAEETAADAAPLEAAADAPDAMPAEPNDPHQLRIAGKSLRYTLEMAREHGRPLSDRVMKSFKSLQEGLGLWHDYVVLVERMLAETIDCDLALHDPALQGQVLGLAQSALKRAQVNLQRVAAQWAKQGPSLAGQIRAAFPLTRPAPLASESAADIDDRAGEEAEPPTADAQLPEDAPGSAVGGATPGSA